MMREYDMKYDMSWEYVMGICHGNSWGFYWEIGRYDMILYRNNIYIYRYLMGM